MAHSSPDIASLRAARDIRGLLAALRHPHALTRALAAGALADLRDREAVAALLEVLRTDPDAHVRERAARALGLLGDRAAVEPLLRALRADRGAHVREEAAAALGALADPGTLQPLLDAMEDRHPSVRRAAAEALLCLGPDAAARLHDLARSSRTRGREAALRALEQHPA